MGQGESKKSKELSKEDIDFIVKVTKNEDREGIKAKFEYFLVCPTLYWLLLIGCACYCPLWLCRPMLYDL